MAFFLSRILRFALSPHRVDRDEWTRCKRDNQTGKTAGELQENRAEQNSGQHKITIGPPTGAVIMHELMIFANRLMKRFSMHHWPFDAIIKLLNIYRDHGGWAAMFFCARLPPSPLCLLAHSVFLSLGRSLYAHRYGNHRKSDFQHFVCVCVLCWCTPIE